MHMTTRSDRVDGMAWDVGKVMNGWMDGWLKHNTSATAYKTTRSVPFTLDSLIACILPYLLAHEKRYPTTRFDTMT